MTIVASLQRLAVLITLPVVTTCVHARHELAPEEVRPATSFVDAKGAKLDLASYRGERSVVLLFMRGFKGDFACYFCGQQMRAYKASYEALRSAGAEVIAVLPGANDVAGFLEKVGTADSNEPDPGFSVPFPVVLDHDFTACRTFSVPFDPNPDVLPFPVSEPATVVVGKDGRVVYAYHGTAPPDRPAVDAIVEILKHGPPRGDARPTPQPSTPTAAAVLPWKPYAEGLALARTDGRPLLLDFHALW